jgi:type IV pilus assembly protein PilA
MPVDSLDDRFPTTPSQGATMRNRKGFTLIELLIVVVIIGILAAIALPKFGETRQRAYVSAMQSDLRNMQTSQEMHYSNPATEYTYWSGTLLPNDPDPVLGFTASSGVTIVVDNAEPVDGYTATASHEANNQLGCRLIVGGTGSQGIACWTNGTPVAPGDETAL